MSQCQELGRWELARSGEALGPHEGEATQIAICVLEGWGALRVRIADVT